jgi:hypothetical protein
MMDPFITEWPAGGGDEPCLWCGTWSEVVDDEGRCGICHACYGCGARPEAVLEWLELDGWFVPTCPVCGTIRLTAEARRSA